MEYSQQFEAFAAAFVAAQAEIEAAAKDKVNPAFRSSYADLASVSEACRPALNKHDIAVLQTPVACAEPNKLTLETWLLHKSGQWAKGTITLPLPKADPQGFGSALTYARRYHLAAMTGVCPEDDDGNGASGRGDAPFPQQRQQARPQQQQSSPRPAPSQQPARPAAQQPAAPARTVIDEQAGEEKSEEHDAAEPEGVSETQMEEIKSLLAAMPQKQASTLGKAACAQHGVARLGLLTADAAAKVIANLRNLAESSKAAASAA